MSGGKRWSPSHRLKGMMYTGFQAAVIGVQEVPSANHNRKCNRPERGMELNGGHNQRYAAQ